MTDSTTVSEAEMKDHIQFTYLLISTLALNNVQRSSIKREIKRTPKHEN